MILLLTFLTLRYSGDNSCDQESVARLRLPPGSDESQDTLLVGQLRLLSLLMELPPLAGVEVEAEILSSLAGHWERSSSPRLGWAGQWCEAAASSVVSRPGCPL